MFSSVHPSTSELKSAHTGRGETDPVRSGAWRGNYGNGLELFHLSQLQVPSGSTPAVPAPFPTAKSSPTRRLRHPHSTGHLLTLRRSGRPPARLLPSRGVSGPGPGDRPPRSPPPPHPRQPPRTGSARLRRTKASGRLTARRDPGHARSPASPRPAPRTQGLVGSAAPSRFTLPTRRTRRRGPPPEPGRPGLRAPARPRPAAPLPAEGLLRGPTPRPALLPAADASASGAHGMAAAARA